MNLILFIWFYLKIIFQSVVAKEKYSKVEKLLQKGEKLTKSMYQNMNSDLPKHKLLQNKTFTDIWVSQFNLIV